MVHLSCKGETKHWVVWELCLSLLQIHVLKYMFLTLFIFPFWSKIRIKVGLSFFCVIVTFKFIKPFCSSIQHAICKSEAAILAFARHPKHPLGERTVTSFQRHQDKRISCENLSGVYTSKDLIIQYLWSNNGVSLYLVQGHSHIHLILRQPQFLSQENNPNSGVPRQLALCQK